MIILIAFWHTYGPWQIPWFYILLLLQLQNYTFGILSYGLFSWARFHRLVDIKKLCTLRGSWCSFYLFFLVPNKLYNLIWACLSCWSLLVVGILMCLLLTFPWSVLIVGIEICVCSMISPSTFTSQLWPLHRVVDHDGILALRLLTVLLQWLYLHIVYIFLSWPLESINKVKDLVDYLYCSWSIVELFLLPMGDSSKIINCYPLVNCYDTL